MSELRARSVLCLEDHDDTRDLLCAVLGDSGIEVVPVPTIAEAESELAKAGSLDGFLIDLWLPDGDGVELCRRLRSSYPDAPIIIFSAAARDDDRAQALAAGATAYFVKPTLPTAVVAEFQRAFGVTE